MTHNCRVCKQPLTLDNIYPSNFKKHDWICKTCDNARRNTRRKKVIPPPQYNPDDVAFKSSCVIDANETGIIFKRGGISNHITEIPKVSGRCQLCEAYDSSTSTCHLLPPPWPRVFKDDYCLQFIHLA